MRQQIPHLTGIRAIAALSVLLAHAVNVAFVYKGNPYLNQYSVPFAYFGMSLFFVLSGFVITYSYSNYFTHKPWNKSLYGFFLARLARLYPLYAFTMLLTLLLRPLSAPLTSIDVITNITLTQAWFNTHYSIFSPSWSISTEWFFYVFFAIYMLFPPRPGSKRFLLWRTIIICEFILAIFYMQFLYKEQIALVLTGIVPNKFHMDVWSWWTYFSPYVRIGEFFMGAFAARLYLATGCRERAPKSKIHALGALCIAGIFSIMLNGAFQIYGADGYFAFLFKNFSYAPFIAMLIYLTARYRIYSFLAHPAILWLGEISYSIYMAQWWIFYQFPHYGTKTPSLMVYCMSSLKVIGIFLLCIPLAYTTHRLIEVPGRIYLRKWLLSPLDLLYRTKAAKA